ncbi:hypothetical protein MHK_004979 [Candidatus Magnetomorum sp. HK-1]|nr:hypothetical protein MHK_004979 [Candidatus Magnetomorum sp. HK-1]
MLSNQKFSGLIEVSFSVCEVQSHLVAHFIFCAKGAEACSLLALAHSRQAKNSRSCQCYDRVGGEPYVRLPTPYSSKIE